MGASPPLPLPRPLLDLGSCVSGASLTGSHTSCLPCSHHGHLVHSHILTSPLLNAIQVCSLHHPLPPALLLGTVTVLGPKAPAPNSPVHAMSPSHFRRANCNSGSYFSSPAFTQAVPLPGMLFLLTNSYSSSETQPAFTSSRRPS